MRRTSRAGQLSLSSRRGSRPSARRRPRPRWGRPGRPAARPPRDWIQISVTALPGLAAVIALIFTSLAIRTTGAQLQVTEQGQITDRYNAAITNLGSSSADVRLGGIFALQRIMQDSPRDQPTIVRVLCAFVRNNASAATAASGSPPASPQSPVPTDIQAALTIVGTRNPAHDGPPELPPIVDFGGADLASAGLEYASLVGANFHNAYLNGAFLEAADLTYASFVGADLTHADLGSSRQVWRPLCLRTSC